MAKDTINIDVKVDDKGTTEKMSLKSKKAGDQFDKTTKQADKYHKGQKGVAQATANSTKAFSKMQGGMTGMVGVYAEIASRVFALSAAFQFLKNASDVTNLIAGQEALGSVTGVAYKTMTADIKAATDGQLAYADAARAAAIGTAAGLSGGQLQELSTAAKNASNALGRDLKDSFDRLVRGVTKAEPELLDELGIILRLDTATQNYADSIGKNKNALSQFEKSQAVVNEVLSQAEEKFGKIEALMDPSAASLNKFLVSFDNLMNSFKKGTMKFLRPVFDFLSNNSAALATGIGILSVSIMKSILPSMAAWKESSEEAFKANLKGLAGYRRGLKKSKKALEDFKLQNVASMDNAKALADKSMGSKGFGTVTKGGGGARDFLSGQSESKRSQQNADKVLKNAEKSLQKHKTVQNGMFKGMNAQQVADMRRSYNIRAGIIKQGEQIHGSAYKRKVMHVKMWAAKTKVAFSSVKTGMAKLGAAAAGFGAKLSAAMGWIGLIGMLATAMISFAKSRLPENVKRSNAASKEFTDTMKTLNEEIDGFVRVADSGMLTATQMAEQQGNAVKSADLLRRTQTLYNGVIDQTSKNFRKNKAELVSTFDKMAKLNPKMKEFLDIVKDPKFGGFTEEQTSRLKAAEDRYKQIGQYTKGLADATKAVRQEFAQLANANKSLNPLAGVLRLMGKEIEMMGGATSSDGSVIAGKLQGIQDQVGAEGEYGIKSIEAKQKELEKIQNKAVKRSRRGRGGYSADQKAADVKAAQNALDAANKQREHGLKQEAELQKQIEINKKLMADIRVIGSSIVKNEKEKIQNQQRINGLLNRGITFEDKKKNLQIKEIQESSKILDLQNKIKVAEANKLSAAQSTAENAADQQESAALALDVANQALANEQARQKISKEARTDKEKLLDLERELLNLVKLRTANELKLMQQQRAMKLEQSGTVSFGLQKAANQRAQQTLILTQKQTIAQDKLNEAIKEQNEKKATTLSEKEAADLQKNVDLAREGVLAAQQELQIHQNISAQLQNQLLAKTQKMQFDSMNAGMNSMQAQYNAEIYKYLEKGVPLNQINTDMIKEQLAQQKQMTQEMEMQATTRDALKSNLSTGIASLIKGEESSLKDAIGKMAEGVLTTVADKLADQMAENLMDSIFNIEDVTLPTQINTAHQTGATTLTSAITAGATTLGGGITTALQTGGASLAAQVAAACAACCGGGVGAPEVPKPETPGIALEGKKVGEISVPGLSTAELGTGEFGGEAIEEVIVTGHKSAIPIFSSFTDNIGDIISGDAPFLEGMGNLFKDLGSDLGGIFGGLTDGLGSILGGLGSSLGGLLGGLGKGIGGIFGGIFGGIGSIFGFRHGGIVSNKMPGYATGGIAKGSERGYPAVLHGTEAVVPLPNGKSIPVDMPKNANNQNNNVTVNISQDGTTETRGTAPDMEAMGQKVAAAVQKELQNQKRSGGILNPYGAS